MHKPETSPSRIGFTNCKLYRHMGRYGGAWWRETYINQGPKPSHARFKFAVLEGNPPIWKLVKQQHKISKLQNSSYKRETLAMPFLIEHYRDLVQILIVLQHISPGRLAQLVWRREHKLRVPITPSQVHLSTTVLYSPKKIDRNYSVGNQASLATAHFPNHNHPSYSQSGFVCTKKWLSAVNVSSKKNRYFKFPLEEPGLVDPASCQSNMIGRHSTPTYERRRRRRPSTDFWDHTFTEARYAHATTWRTLLWILWTSFPPSTCDGPTHGTHWNSTRRNTINKHQIYKQIIRMTDIVLKLTIKCNSKVVC